MKIIFSPSFIRKTDLATVEAQRAAPHPNATGYNDEKHNKIIHYFVDCHFITKFRFEAQHATPLLSFPIVNRQFSIASCFGLTEEA